MPSELKVDLGKLILENPVIAASGCYGYGLEYAEVSDPAALGGFVTKSITPEPREGNEPPRIAETSGGMINSIGLANMGVSTFAGLVAPKLKSLGTRAIVSVAGNDPEDYRRVVERLEDIDGLDGYELNISCPNVKEGGMAFSQNPRITEELVAGVRKSTGRWLSAKLTPNVARISEGAKAAEAGGADALSLINTVVGMVVDHRTRKPKIAAVTGGYSGPPIKPIALARIWETWNAVDIPLIGMGGITCWEDIVEFMLVGASAVQVGTALFADPELPEKLTGGLQAYLSEEGIASIGELVGTLRTDSPFTHGAPD